MNREQKSAAIDEIADQIRASEAVFAVDYRGITVTQAATLRGKLRDADATFRVVKNTLTERAADAADAEALKSLLEGPTALTFVRGDVAVAAKALADEQRASGDKLAFKGGLLNGTALDAAQIGDIAKLPSRQVLYGQLVGMVAFPVAGLARTLNQLIGGLAVALGQVQEKKESGEIPAGAAPATPPAEAAPAAEATPEPAPDPEAAPGDSSDTQDQDAEPPTGPVSSEDPVEGPDTTTDQTPQED